MALNFTTISSPQPNPLISFLPKHKQLFNKSYYNTHESLRPAAALSEGSGGVTDEEDPRNSKSLSSTRTQLDLLEQLTSGSSSVDGYESDGSSGRLTIRDQLANLFGDRDGNFSIPLGKNLKKFTPKFLTISQKRNIKRQTYMNEVSKRNDSVFFASIGVFVIFPPLIILGIAIATGYVQFLP